MQLNEDNEYDFVNVSRQSDKCVQCQISHIALGLALYIHCEKQR